MAKTSTIAFRVMVCGLALAWSVSAPAANSTINLGSSVPSVEQVKEGLYPEQVCEELRQAGYKCMGFKPAVNFTLPTARFALGSAELPEGLRNQLEVFAKVLKERGAASPEIRIVGHADASGSDELNNALSRQRALAVKSFLTSQGVAPSLLVIHGEGARKLADSSNPLSSVNRRIEIGRLSAR